MNFVGKVKSSDLSYNFAINVPPLSITKTMYINCDDDILIKRSQNKEQVCIHSFHLSWTVVRFIC
jgi:hypothetical protein